MTYQQALKLKQGDRVHLKVQGQLTEIEVMQLHNDSTAQVVYITGAALPFGTMYFSVPHHKFE